MGYDLFIVMLVVIYIYRLYVYIIKCILGEMGTYNAQFCVLPSDGA